jgi:hypothetical protein
MPRSRTWRSTTKSRRQHPPAGRSCKLPARRPRFRRTRFARPGRHLPARRPWRRSLAGYPIPLRSARRVRFLPTGMANLTPLRRWRLPPQLAEGRANYSPRPRYRLLRGCPRSRTSAAARLPPARQRRACLALPTWRRPPAVMFATCVSRRRRLYCNVSRACFNAALPPAAPCLQPRSAVPAPRSSALPLRKNRSSACSPSPRRSIARKSRPTPLPTGSNPSRSRSPFPLLLKDCFSNRRSPARRGRPLSRLRRPPAP